jgi:hypothetical protein
LINPRPGGHATLRIKGGPALEFMFININKIEEFANHFNNVNLKYAEKIKGFDPKKIFVGHMLSVGFNKSLI